MRKLILALGCTAMVVPTMVLPLTPASAQRHDRHRRYNDRNHYDRCKKTGGTTGAIVGGVGGALLGRTIAGRNDRTLGTVGGAVAGGLAGRALQRGGSNPKDCR